MAMDYEGTILASSQNPEMAGTSALSYTDIHGSSIGRELIMLAKNGGGAAYMSQYDKEEENVRIYMLNVEPIDADWFVVTVVRMGKIAV